MTTNASGVMNENKILAAFRSKILYSFLQKIKSLLLCFCSDIDDPVIKESGLSTFLIRPPKVHD
jgi:hypothetical protein